MLLQNQGGSSWVLIAVAAAGGLIGALAKFVFEQVLASRFQESRSARATVRKYSYPLLRAADTLDRRLENYIMHVKKGWFDLQDDDYYRLGTLYQFGSYFAWCTILEEAAFIGHHRSNQRAREFSRNFYTVFKGLSGFHCFSEFERVHRDVDVSKAGVPRLALTAIGELMVRRTEDGVTVMGFVDFCREYRASSEFKEWFRHVEDLFREMRPSKRDPRWNRILVFATTLRAFIFFLDPQNRQTSPRAVNYLERMSPDVSKVLRSDLRRHGHAFLIGEAGRISRWSRLVLHWQGREHMRSRLLTFFRFRRGRPRPAPAAAAAPGRASDHNRADRRSG